MPTDIATGPLADARRSLGLSKAELARILGITWHAVHNAEKGLYNHIPPSILEFYDDPELAQRYQEWISHERFSNTPEIPAVPRFDPDDSHEHPFLIWRESFNPPLSRVGFCKIFKVHNGVMYDYETGVKRAMPRQLFRALIEAGVDAGLVLSLDQMGKTYHDAIRNRP